MVALRKHGYECVGALHTVAASTSWRQDRPYKRLVFDSRMTSPSGAIREMAEKPKPPTVSTEAEWSRVWGGSTCYNEIDLLIWSRGEEFWRAMSRLYRKVEETPCVDMRDRFAVATEARKKFFVSCVEGEMPKLHVVVAIMRLVAFSQVTNYRKVI